VLFIAVNYSVLASFVLHYVIYMRSLMVRITGTRAASAASREACPVGHARVGQHSVKLIASVVANLSICGSLHLWEKYLIDTGHLLVQDFLNQDRIF